MNAFLSSLRSAHATLIVISLTLFAFAASPNDVRRFVDAETELRTLLNLDYDKYVAFVQPFLKGDLEKQETTLAVVYRRHGIDLDRDFNIGRPQVIAWPKEDPVVADLVAFFEGEVEIDKLGVVTPYVEYGNPAYLGAISDALYPIQMIDDFRRKCGSGCSRFSVYSVSILRIKDIPDSGGGGETVYKFGPPPINRLGGVQVDAMYTDGADSRFARAHVLFSGNLELLPVEPFRGLYPQRWLQSQPRVAERLSYGSENERVWFPALHEVWDEVARQHANDAVRYLAERAEAHQGSLSFFGVSIDTRVLLLAGPLALFLASGFLLSLIRMTNAAIAMTPGFIPKLYPWVGLYSDRLSILAMVGSLVLLPAGSVAALVWASWSGLAPFAFGAILGAALICIMNTCAVRELARLRSHFAEAALPADSEPPSAGA